MKEIYLILVMTTTFFFCKSNITEEKALSIAPTKVLRTVACILIVFGHCTAIDRQSLFADFNVGWYCVAIFMFISGWGITLSYRRKSDYLYNFWKTRLIKILIPFFSAHLIYWVVKSLYGIQYTEKDLFLGLLGQCTIVDHSWYPIAVIVLYFLFWLVFRLKISDHYKATCLTVLVIVVTYIESFIFGELRDWWYISNFSFALGSVLQIHDDRIQSKKKYLALAILGYGCSYCILPVVHKLFNTYSFSLYILASNLRSMFLCLAIITITVYFNPRSRFFERVGAISYEIYLIHGLFIFLFSQYTHNIVLVFGLTIFCSVVCAVILKKIHSIIIKCFCKNN